MTASELHQRLTDLRLTSCPWADFTSSTARHAIEGYEYVIAGRHQGKPIDLEHAYAVVYGEAMRPKRKRA